jgi:shikimate kinase
MNAITNDPETSRPAPTRSLVIVGMPGSGKSSVGRKLAARLGLPFTDSDVEVEAAANMKVDEIFDQLGEAAFREGERRVIARLLDGSPRVISTGGGAFMDDSTRALVRERALSVWLRADFGILLERTSRRDDRPLLRHGDPAKILQELLAEREVHYAEADIVVTSDKRPVENTVERVMKELEARG